MAKLSRAETMSKARIETRARVMEILKPYHPRGLNWQPGPKDTGIHYVETWVIFSPVKDDEGSYPPQGLIKIEFYKEGGCCPWFSEDTFSPLLGVPADSKWERTEAVLKLVTAKKRET
jgi:hypothetical protein